MDKIRGVSNTSGSFVIDSFLIVALRLFVGEGVFGPRFHMQYFPVLPSSQCGRESWLLYLN